MFPGLISIGLPLDLRESASVSRPGVSKGCIVQSYLEAEGPVDSVFSHFPFDNGISFTPA